MEHSEAVRIARGGEGAVVAVILRFAEELEKEKEHVAKLQKDVEDLLDKQ